VRATAQGDEAAAAFATARARVLAATEPGYLDHGLKGLVQKYAFIDPEAETVHHCTGPVCFVTGRPRRQCPLRGRMRPPEGMKRVTPGWRGRLATGEPTMLLQAG
jgi:hypothetical protein